MYYPETDTMYLAGNTWARPAHQHTWNSASLPCGFTLTSRRTSMRSFSSGTWEMMPTRRPPYELPGAPVVVRAGETGFEQVAVEFVLLLRAALLRFCPRGIGGAGVLACGFGLIITYPWMMCSIGVFYSDLKAI